MVNLYSLILDFVIDLLIWFKLDMYVVCYLYNNSLIM